MKKIAIIGCGHGGQALAAHLSLTGCDVALYADPKHSAALLQIQQTSTIELHGVLSGKATLPLLTTDLCTALAGRDIIYLALPTSAHEKTFIEMLPYLQEGQIIVNLPGNFSSLHFLQLQKQQGIRTPLIFADASSFPYACRAEMPGQVKILGLKQTLRIAALPAQQTQHVIEQLQEHFPNKLIPARNILELGLNIDTGLTHPVLALLNAGRIGNGKDLFYFYKEGITPEIATLLENMEQERHEIGQRLGCQMTDYLEIMGDYYGNYYATLYDFFTQSPVHNAAKLCPTALNHRYITQDIPYVLVPWFNLGQLAGYHAATIHTVIQLASYLLKTDFLNTGRNLANMGLIYNSIPETLDYINKGLSGDKIIQTAA